MSIFDFMRRKKNNEPSSASLAKERLLEVCISHRGSEDESSELIQKIQEAVLKILNEHYGANIDIGNIKTNLKKEDEVSYVDLQVHLPEDEKSKS